MKGICRFHALRRQNDSPATEAAMRNVTNDLSLAAANDDDDDERSLLHSR